MFLAWEKKRRLTVKGVVEQDMNVHILFTLDVSQNKFLDPTAVRERQQDLLRVPRLGKVHLPRHIAFCAPSPAREPPQLGGISPAVEEQFGPEFSLRRSSPNPAYERATEEGDGSDGTGLSGVPHWPLPLLFETGTSKSALDRIEPAEGRRMSIL